jgi:hypothetical protein
MNSNEINVIIKTLNLKSFLGVFGLDELKLITPHQTGTLIFNTQPSHKIGQHWIAACITDDKLFYYDSLKGDLSPSVLHFFNWLGKDLFLNKLQTQHNSSDKCGIHCIVFCFIMEKSANSKIYESFLKTFLSLNVAQREKQSLEYFTIIKQYGRS